MNNREDCGNCGGAGDGCRVCYGAGTVEVDDDWQLADAGYDYQRED